MEFRGMMGASALAILMGAITPACADESVVAFYKGRTIDLVVGYGTGGGYDTYARALAPHLAKHVPGAPQIVIRNMPGASSLTALRHVATAAARDGSIIGAFNPTLIALTRLEDFKTKKASIGATGQGSGAIYGVILKHIFGDNVQVVTGYPSTNDIALAMERGEVDGMCTGWGVVEVTKPDWITRRFVNVLTQFAGQRDKRIASVPLIHEASLPAGMSEAITFLTLSDMATRPFVGPAGIPADRAAALRRAFDTAMGDSEFLAFAKKASLDIDPTTGEDLAKIVRGIFATSPGALEFARKFYN